MPSQSFHEIPAITFPRWEKGNFNRPRSSYGIRSEYAPSVISARSDVSDDFSDLRSECCDSVCSDNSWVSVRTPSVWSVRSSRRGSCGTDAAKSIQSYPSLDQDLFENRTKVDRVLLSKNARRIMSLLVAAGIAAIAGLLYNVPIMQRVEMKSLRQTLNRNVYCQQNAIDELMRHVTEYTVSGRKGPVILFLAGSEGSGKTHTINTIAEVNPSWAKLVATHEQGYLNQLGEGEFIGSIRQKLHTSSLNFIFVDDVPSLREGTAFVEMKLKPLLRALKFDKYLVFIVITMLSEEHRVVPPSFLTDEWEYQVIHYGGLNRSCVKRCAVDVIQALDKDVGNVNFDDLLRRFDFEENSHGEEISLDGCKSVPIKVAIYLEGDPPTYDDSEVESPYPDS